MNWIILAQAIPDAKELADGDAQKVLAYVTVALVFVVVSLFGLLVRVVISHRNEVKEIYQAHESKIELALAAHKVEVTGLNDKNDKLQERLLRYVANMNQMLAGQSAPADPLSPNGGAV